MRRYCNYHRETFEHHLHRRISPTIFGGLDFLFARLFSRKWPNILLFPPPLVINLNCSFSFEWSRYQTDVPTEVLNFMYCLWHVLWRFSPKFCPNLDKKSRDLGAGGYRPYIWLHIQKHIMVSQNKSVYQITMSLRKETSFKHWPSSSLVSIFFNCRQFKQKTLPFVEVLHYNIIYDLDE